MRVLTIAQSVALLQGYRHLIGKALRILPQVLGDSGVIDSDVLEGLLGQPLTLSEVNAPPLQFLQDQRVVGRIDHHDNTGEILGRRPHHGRPADINILQRLGKGNPFLSYCLDKGVKVDRH